MHVVLQQPQTTWCQNSTDTLTVTYRSVQFTFSNFATATYGIPRCLLFMS